MAFRLNVHEQNQANAYRDALEKQRQAEEAQRQAYDRAAQAQANAQQAQSKQMNPLEGVLSGIGDAVKNVGDTLYNMAGTGGAALRDLFTGNAGTGKYQNEWKDYAKKSIYGDENLSDKDYYLKTGGKAVDAASTVSDLIPGLGAGARVALNVGQGVASGAVNPLIQYGSGASLEDVLRGGIVGGAGAGAGQYVGGKLASKVPGTSRLSRIATSNLGRGALTGAASGAVAGGLNAGFTGNDILGGALQGAQSGGLGGATMAGVMGVAGKGIEKLQNKYGVNTPATPAVAQAPEVEAPTRPVVQNVVEDTTPTVKTPVKRGIPVTDYDAGEQNIRVRRPDTEYSLGRRQGSNIDGILAPDNVRQLPNVKRPNPTIGEYMLGDSSVTRAADAVPRLIDETYGNGFTKPMFDDFFADLDDATRARLAQGVQDAAALNNMAGDEYTVNKSQLPKIKRSDYVKATGYSGKDIPEYMRPYLSEKNGVPLGDGSWSQYMPKYNDGGTFTGTPDDVIQMYDNLANTNKSNANIYNAENVGMALAMDSDLDKAVTGQFLKAGYPTRKIDVKGMPSIADNIDVDALGGNTAPIKRTIPARTAQAPETPTQARPAIRRATDMPAERQVNPNLSVGDRAKYERQLTVNRQRQGAALLEQYGTLDKPVRRAVGSPEEVLSTLYDEYGLTTPADVQYAANHVTGRDGVVSQMTRELAGKAQNVDTRIDKKWLDNIMDLNGLDDKEAKAVTNQIAAALKRTSANGFTDGNTTLDTVKQLEAQASRYKGKDGTYHNATPADKAKGAVIDLVRDELQARIWDAAGDASSVVTPQRLQQLKDMYPGNQKWANFVDGTIANVKTGGDLRHTMKPLVDGSKIVNGSKMAAGGYADRAYKAATSRNPIVAGGQIAMDAFLDSDRARQIRADHYAKKAAKAEAKLTGTDYVDPTSGRTKTSGLSGAASELWQGTKNIAGKAGQKLGNAARTLNNETLLNARLGGNVGQDYNMPSFGDLATRQTARQAGLGAMRAQDTERDIQNANIDMQNALQDYTNASNDMLQAQNSMQNMQQQGTGASSLDRISQALNAALMAGDVNAYKQLADLYKQAAAIYQLQNPTATTSDAKALNATQAKAVTGLSQLQQLASMQPGARTALSNSPLSGLVDLTGGDSYNSQADSLASTIGYLLSGANIKKDEIEAVKRDYIPSTFDSQAVRQQKLSRAEQLLRNYLADTNALTAL